MPATRTLRLYRTLDGVEWPIARFMDPLDVMAAADRDRRALHPKADVSYSWTVGTTDLFGDHGATHHPIDLAEARRVVAQFEAQKDYFARYQARHPDTVNLTDVDDATLEAAFLRDMEP